VRVVADADVDADADADADTNAFAQVLSVAGTPGKPTLGIMFRNTFNINQRYYLENVRWALTPGSFYHDDAHGLLYYWPHAATPTPTMTPTPAPGEARGEAREAPPVGVVAPVLDRLIDLRHASGHAVQNLTLTDTTYFADGYWDGPVKPRWNTTDQTKTPGGHFPWFRQLIYTYLYRGPTKGCVTHRTCR